MCKIEGVQIDDGPREHFIECPECGEWLDMRDLDEVLNHHCVARSMEELKADPSTSVYNDGPATDEGGVWDAVEIEVIRAAIEHGVTVEEMAEMLCRSTDETRLKIELLGLLIKPPTGPKA